MSPPQDNRQAGYTLVELVLVQLLGLLVVGAALRLMPAGLSLQNGANGVFLLQETERMALDTLDHLVAQAGFSGCHDGQAHARAIRTTHPDVSPRLARWAYDRFRLFGRDADDVLGTDQVMGTGWSRGRHHHDGIPVGDLLWLQSTEGAAMTVVQHDPSVGSLVVVAEGPSELAAGAVIRVADCRHAATFQVATDRPPTVDRDTGLITLDYGSGTTVNCGAAEGGPVLLGGHSAADCDESAGDLSDYRFSPGSTVMPLASTLLYVGRHQQTGEPGLYRLRPASNGVRAVSESLVEGVENLRLRYGVDTDTDGAVDAWWDADAVAASPDGWAAVMAVRAWVMFRTTDHRGGTRFRKPVSFPDEAGEMVSCGGGEASPLACPFRAAEDTATGYQRRVVEKTVMLRNRPWG